MPMGDILGPRDLREDWGIRLRNRAYDQQLSKMTFQSSLRFGAAGLPASACTCGLSDAAMARTTVSPRWTRICRQAKSMNRRSSLATALPPRWLHNLDQSKPLLGAASKPSFPHNAPEPFKLFRHALAGIQGFRSKNVWLKVAEAAYRMWNSSASYQKTKSCPKRN